MGASGCWASQAVRTTTQQIRPSQFPSQHTAHTCCALVHARSSTALRLRVASSSAAVSAAACFAASSCNAAGRQVVEVMDELEGKQGTAGSIFGYIDAAQGEPFAQPCHFAALASCRLACARQHTCGARARAASSWPRSTAICF